MKLVRVVFVVSISAAVSADAWPDVNWENAAAKSLIVGALGSGDALAPCRCAIPRECSTTPNSCECLNSAAVSCWLKDGQNCRLELTNCGAPNSPPTSSNSQFPPCLIAAAAGTNPLPPCAQTAACRKLDHNCRDGILGGSSSCIGICVPRTMVAGGQGQPPQKAPASSPNPLPQSGNAGQRSSKPNNQPAGQVAPAGPNWGTPGAPVANAPGPIATPWSPPPGGPQPANGPPPAQNQPVPQFAPQAPQAPPQAQPPPPAPLSVVAQNVGACPATIKCPGNNICTPDPKIRSSYLCVQPLEQCAGIQSQPCQGGKSCVADPRIQCKGQTCTGLCV